MSTTKLTAEEVADIKRNRDDEHWPGLLLKLCDSHEHLRKQAEDAERRLSTYDEMARMRWQQDRPAEAYPGGPGAAYDVLFTDACDTIAKLTAALDAAERWISKTNHLADCNMIAPLCANCGTLCTIHKDFAARKNCIEYVPKGCTCGLDSALAQLAAARKGGE